MEFRQFLRVLWARRLFIVACVVVCTGIAAALAWTRTPTYTAHTQLFIAASAGSDAGAAYQGALFSEGRALSYVEIASSPPVLDAVIKQLNLGESRQQLREQIQASVPVNTVVFNVAVQNRSADQAAAIAGAFASQFAKFVDQLESQPSGRSPVKVSVTSPAQTPTSPTAPRKAMYLALGFVLGLALGIAGAVLFETFHRPIRTEDDASAIAGAAVLGSVAEYTGRKVRPPVVTADPSSARAEAYRRLRENLRTLVEKTGAASFVISSPAPNDGKTGVAANLGVAFAQAGYRVVLVDANLRRPKLATMLGVPSAPGLTNMVEDMPLASLIQTWREGLPLGVIPGGSEPQDPSGFLGSKRFLTMLEELKARFDVTIIDAPGLLEATDAGLIARATSGAVVVVQWSTRSADLAASVESLHAVNASTLGVVLNRRLRRGWFRRRPRPVGYGSAPSSFDHPRVAVPLESSPDG